MTYAPVCIPTLNRYEHLRKCLESLSRCTWADQTEVYVALDYPPLDQWDKYAPGWEKNRDWLRSIGDFGFKKLHLIEREENYGTWMSGDKGNMKCLCQMIRGKYDRFITTEDDNVFAPSFLEFMNKGLELFKDDEKVAFLGGYKFYFPIQTDSNSYFRIDADFSPWGVGNWTEKVQNRPILNYKWFRQQFSFGKAKYILKTYGWGMMNGWLAHMVKQHQPEHAIDNYVWTYMALTGKQQIIPTQTLVENIGMDGSGCGRHNCIGEEWYDSTLNPMNINEHFDFIGTGYECFETNQQIYVQNKYWMTQRQYFVKCLRKIAKIIYSEVMVQ